MLQVASSDASGLGRYVLPVDHAAPLDDDGFLVVSEGETRPSGSPLQPRPVRELLVDQPSYVLLAAGGVGKTRTFRALSDAEEHTRYLDIALLDRTELREALDSAVADGGPVYLDALDQATLTYPALFRMLGQELTTPAARGLEWRLACRTAAWPASLAQELKEHLAGFEELNLAPLDRSTAHDVVTAAGFNGVGFVDALVQAGRGRLSASPQRLLAAARHWHAEGTLPDGHLSAIDFEVRQLLTETDDGRTPRLSINTAGAVAKRLGAFASFTGMQLVTAGPASNTVSTSIVDLPSEPEPDEPGSRIGPDEYREVLGTALFVAGPSGGLLFRHQQYAEFLAAGYLVDRGITSSQLPALLGMHTNGLLPGARIGVAAWLAALQPPLAAPLIRDNARAFIAAAIELPEETRATVVDDLLRQAAEADDGHDWSLDLSGLAYPGLADQLGTLFSAGLASTEQFFWACRLAVAGECRVVSELIAQQALSSAWSDWVRRTAVQSVASLGDQAALRSLRTLITVAPHDDPAEELLAATIDALYPDMLTTAELLPVLRAAQTPHYFGGYVLSLRSMAERIPVDDLPAVLRWFTKHHNDSPSDTTFDDFYRLLVQRAWAVQHSVELRTALADFLSSTADSRYLLHQRSSKDSIPWILGESHRRREFAVTVAERMVASSSYKLLVLCLVTHDDIVWLLDQLPSLSEPAQPVLARCLPQLLGTPSAAIADRILVLDASHPAFEATAWLRDSVDTNSPSVQPQRDFAASTQRFRQQQAERMDQVVDELANALSRVESDPSTWWQVMYLISIDESGDANGNVFGHDVTRRPGWALLSSGEQSRLYDHGVTYLRNHQLTPENWRGLTNVVSDRVLPDWCGVYLMTTLVRHDRTALQTLEPDVWRKWAPAIMAAWSSDTDEDRRLRRELVRAAPDGARHDLAQAALDHLVDLSGANQPLQPRDLYEELLDDLAPALAQGLLTRRYSVSIGVELLALLAQYAPSIAARTSDELRQDPASPLAVEATQHLAALDPNRTVDDLDAVPASDLAAVAQHLRVDALDLTHLAQAGRLLLDGFPFDSDPPLTTGFVETTPAREARRVRTAVLHRIAELGGTNQLAELRHGRGPIDRAELCRLERAARANEADLALTNPTPAELLELLRHGDHRLIRNDADLVNVVIEHLRKLQHDISHDGAFREVWNETTSPKSEDDISDWVRRRLTERLDKHVVVDREIQVLRRQQAGVGTRIDITTTAPTATYPAGTTRVITEAKLANNRELMTSLQHQLVERYLIPLVLRHGIYLVYWVTPAQRPEGWSRSKAADLPKLEDELTQQAAAVAPDFLITPFVLDISRPTA